MNHIIWSISKFYDEAFEISMKLSVKDVRPKIEKTVNLFLSKYYIRSDAVQSVQTMCDHVKEELKRFKFYRYRYVVSGTFHFSRTYQLSSHPR